MVKCTRLSIEGKIEVVKWCLEVTAIVWAIQVKLLQYLSEISQNFQKCMFVYVHICLRTN